jgi:hypothetical protein
MVTMVISVSTLAIEPVMKNSAIDWRLRDAEGRSHGAEQARRATEGHHQEGVDDVQRTAGRTGRADGGEGRARDAGDAAADREGQAVGLGWC